jgi:hypothetical protein
LGFGGSYAPPGFGNLKPSFLVIWRYRGYCPQLRITGEAEVLIECNATQRNFKIQIPLC